MDSKSAFMQNYLKQQQNSAKAYHQVQGGQGQYETAIVPANNYMVHDPINDVLNGESYPVYGGIGTEPQDGIDQALLEEFKNQVKLWMDLDTQIKRLQIAVKERKNMQKSLNEKILNFMEKNNIEDLNTKEGILRYKSSVVKAPLKQKQIKEQLYEHFGKDKKNEVVLNSLFSKKEQRERVSLRRIKC